MVSAEITLKLAEHVKRFVNVVNKYNFEVDLRSGRFIVDAKSILGIFSLDLSKPVTMEIHTDGAQAKDMLNQLKDFII